MFTAIGLLELILVVVAFLVLLTAAVPLTLAWFGIKAATQTVRGPWILGVCSSLAKRRGVPVVAVRLLTVLLTMLTGVVPGVIVYLLLGVFLDQWITSIPASPLAEHPSDTPPRPSPADDHIGRYRIIGTVGRGGMGTVYRGRDDALHRDVAVKVLHPRFATDEGPASSIVERFAEEARSIARLTSPHVVQIYEFEPQATPPYLAMEFVDGPSLQQILRKKQTLSPEATVDCGRQVLAGLAAAHAAGIIHRDVKPANILRSATGTYKLTDFGLARSFERAENLTMTGTLLGTVSYLAPEVAGGDEATASSDLYSLGVTLYQMLAGTTPFGDGTALKLLRQIAAEDPPPLSGLRDDIPEALASWLMKLLARDPADRFASATAALAALETLNLGQPETREFAGVALHAAVSAPRLDPHREPDRWIPRSDVDSILRTAMRMESNGESLMGERSVLEIARELDVDTAFVRKTLAAYQNVSVEERAAGTARGMRGHHTRWRREIFIWLLLAAGLAVFLGIGFSRYWDTPRKRADKLRVRNEARLETMQTTLPVPLGVNEPEQPAEPRIILLDSDSEPASADP